MDVPFDQNPQAASKNATSDGEKESLARIFDAMLGESDYLFPLSSANRQFRAFYYGMASAAMLEDVFVDALANFLQKRRPATAFLRPPRGEKGWDYEVAGQRVSHKVAKKPDNIAVLWDATIEITHWDVEHPIVFVTSGFGAAAVKARDDRGLPLSFKPLDSDLKLGPSTEVVVVHWPRGGTSARVVASIEPTESTSADHVLHFTDIWPAIASQIADGIPANELEVLARTRTGRALEPLPVDSSLEFEPALRPGVYVLTTEALQHTPVKRNNRAVLIPKETIEARMRDAVVIGNFTPISTWIQAFASNRPPDLYLAQRSDWDTRFSSSVVAAEAALRTTDPA